MRQLEHARRFLRQAIVILVRQHQHLALLPAPGDIDPAVLGGGHHPRLLQAAGEHGDRIAFRHLQLGHPCLRRLERGGAENVTFHPCGEGLGFAAKTGDEGEQRKKFQEFHNGDEMEWDGPMEHLHRTVRLSRESTSFAVGVPNAESPSSQGSTTFPPLRKLGRMQWNEFRDGQFATVAPTTKNHAERALLLCAFLADLAAFFAAFFTTLLVAAGLPIPFPLLFFPIIPTLRSR
jgi:hypothetical protein